MDLQKTWGEYGPMYHLWGTTKDNSNSCMLCRSLMDNSNSSKEEFSHLALQPFQVVVPDVKFSLLKAVSMCIVLFSFGLIVSSVITYEVFRPSYCFLSFLFLLFLSLFSFLIRVTLLIKPLVSHCFPLHCSPTFYIDNVPFLLSQFLQLLQGMHSYSMVQI